MLLHDILIWIVVGALAGALLFILFLFLLKQIWNYIFKKMDESLEK